ncbi:radical SAM family heme chaperone HemW [Methylobacillus flagellatus]|uniref:radical SAM family heme chaperone HemW n=1 Tax=Methylobacillus flagellatus TaxID=405 RepID=UPI0010F515CE|nr:radical SAM family heme chaperone HemW [Methylobacillus flagellatus]
MIPIIPVDSMASSSGGLAASVQPSGLSTPPPLALYIHIPWCVRKCPYCDFNSHESRSDIPEDAYVDALIADLEQSVPRVWGRKIRSVFFGGGTPSLFSAAAIDRILANVRMLTPLEYDAEVTLEANPGTVDTAHFKGYREAGVNRVSLGIQSFNEQHLKALGRIHDREQAISAAKLALATFDSVNLDLMYGLPGQTLAQALEDVTTACALGPAHLSCYHLTLEPNTPFHRTPPPGLPDDDTTAGMQEAIEALLAQHGYSHYETSGFAQAGKRCRHNLNYWTFGDYLGIGAGAHSKLSYHDKITRETRHKHPKRYLELAPQGQAVDQTWTIPTDELGFEFMMNTLRLTEGFDTRLFQQRTGLPLSAVQDAINLARRRELLTVTPEAIQPTLLGQRYLNELLQLFL